MTLAMETEEIREQKSLFDVCTDEEDDEVLLEQIRPPKSFLDVEPDNREERGETIMQTLDLCEQPETKKEKGFWRRQFQQEPTRRQKQYDWTFGVIMPVACFFFDPFIFRFWGQSGGGLLGGYKPFAYVGSFVSILLLMAWLLWREKLGSVSALLAGLFFVASSVALSIGIVLLPFSLIGLMALIGVLGFTPLFTAVIYLRNGVRALRSAKPDLSLSKLVTATLVGSLWGFAVPYALNAEVNRSLELIANGTPATVRVQGLKLRLLAPIVDSEKLNKAYWQAPTDSPTRSEIRVLYQQMTGNEFKEYPRWD